MHDFRPGRKASAEAGIRSPLLEAGLTKAEIRRLSRAKNLPTWDRPASPCLASRIPYGTPVTAETLNKIARGEQYLHSLGFRQLRLRHHDKIARGEQYLHSLGFRQLRLRHHGDIARIELDQEDMVKIITPEIRQDIVTKLKALGYKYVALDLTGYRTGSLNEVLNLAGDEGKNG
ncbi:MAG: hypothetical protein ABR914_05515 [Dehalococcoidales bacterium]